MTTNYAEALFLRLVTQDLTVDRKHPATTNVRAKWHIQASGAPSFAEPTPKTDTTNVPAC